MVLVIGARSAMPKVEATLEWLDTVKLCSPQDPPPFSDCSLFPPVCLVPNHDIRYKTCELTPDICVYCLQEMLKDSVENMALNTYSNAGDEIEGVRLLKFSEREWVDSTCVLAGLIFFMQLRRKGCGIHLARLV
jgi:hypothetical protein